MGTTTLAQLKADVSSLVVATNIAIKSFVASNGNVAGLLDKIGKITHIVQNLQKDKLAMFDGEYMDWGKTIEEWESDLTPVASYDATGANALAPDDASYRPVSYSYTLGRQRFKKTIRYDNLERAVNNPSDFAELIADLFYKLEASLIQYRYAMKRQMISVFYTKCATRQSTSATEYVEQFDKTHTYNKDATVSDSSGNIYVVFKKYTANDSSDLAGAIADGYLVQLDLITAIAKPVDTSTGEAFIEQLKKDVEIAEDVSEGHSINGNTLGADAEGLVLVVRQGIMPNLEVKTQAGAFHLDKVALPTEVVVVKDFGDASSDVYAMLVDRRAMRLHPTYNATRENLNGEGDFLNVYRHTENTAYLSLNAFVKFYKVPQA